MRCGGGSSGPRRELPASAAVPSSPIPGPPARWPARVAACVGGGAFVPHPLTDAERSAEASQDMAEVFAAQEPLTHALTLEEAFARAMAYNLDERVKGLERQVAARDFEISKFDLLPKVIANAGASTRNNELAS